MHRLAGSAFWLVVGALASLPGTARAETYYGPEIATIARQTIDVLKLHQHALERQLAFDKAPAFFELSMRSTPATLQFDDGARTKAGITRLGLSTGFGFGKPRTGFAAFAGIQVDMVATTEFPNIFVQKREGLEVGQGAVYGGLAVYGFQVSGGVMAETTGRGLNPQGYFTRRKFEFREGTPPEVIDAAQNMNTDRLSTFLTFTQAEGLTVGATLAKLQQDAKTQLAALRAQLAPERLMQRLDLRERLGVPGIGLNRYAAEIDYWGDRYQELRRQAEALANGVRSIQNVAENPLGQTSEQRQETWEIPIFVNDIAGTGIRAAVIPQVKPEVKLRAVEAGYFLTVEHLKLGARAFAFQRGSSFTGSGEAYVALQPGFFEHFSIFGVPWATLSYSYNAPESATFLPIPNAHVIGVQWVYGPPEMGRPLIPLQARPDQERDL